MISFSIINNTVGTWRSPVYFVSMRNEAGTRQAPDLLAVGSKSLTKSVRCETPAVPIFHFTKV